MKQPRRSAMEDHVHRIAPMGARVLINGAWYKLNGVEPFACMKTTLEALAAGHPNADIDMLLPWNFSAFRTAAAA
jgi:hypothetical protein